MAYDSTVLVKGVVVPLTSTGHLQGLCGTRFVSFVRRHSRPSDRAIHALFSTCIKPSGDGDGETTSGDAAQPSWTLRWFQAMRSNAIERKGA